VHVKRIRFPILAALAILTAFIAVFTAAQPYPIDVNVDSYAPERGKTLSFWVDITALRYVDIIVKASVYVPGKGWSGWKELWRGSLYAGESKRVWGSEYIPSDAKAGSVVIWYSVHYMTSDSYQLIEGTKYYNTYDYLWVAGTLPDPDVELWKAEAARWKASADAWQANYTRLRSDYTLLQQKYSDLESKYSDLERKYSALQSELATVRSERDRLLVEVSVMRLTALAAALLGFVAGAVVMWFVKERQRARTVSS
jgi:hypothetical protein